MIRIKRFLHHNPKIELYYLQYILSRVLHLLSTCSKAYLIVCLKLNICHLLSKHIKDTKKSTWLTSFWIFSFSNVRNAIRFRGEVTKGGNVDIIQDQILFDVDCLDRAPLLEALKNRDACLSSWNTRNI